MLAAIPSPSVNGIHIGPLFIHAYGLMYALALLAAVALSRRRWQRQGGRRELVDEVALWGFPAGLIGGRIYHLATSWNEVPDHWWGPLAIWKGGLGIWGGIAGGTLAGLIVLHRRRADIPAFLDAAAPGLLVAQAIGRIGNYFNQELFGGPTSLPWGLEISAAHRPDAYAQYATFHPSSMSCCGIWRSPRCSSGWDAAALSARPGCSGFTSPGTRWHASARNCSAWTPPTISSACG